MKNEWGLDDILQMRNEHIELRAGARKVIDERLSILNDETAAQLIVTVKATAEDRLKAWKFMLKDVYGYDYENRVFLNDSSKATYEYRDDFRAIRNEYEKMVVVHNVFCKLEQANTADTSESSPKEIYSAALRTIISEWETLGVVITYADLGSIVKHELPQRYDECASYHYQWLASVVASMIKCDSGWRLAQRLKRQKKEWDVPEEVELVSNILEKIAELRPVLRSSADVDSLIGKISGAVEKALRSVWETFPRGGGCISKECRKIFQNVEKALKWRNGILAEVVQDFGHMNSGDSAEATELIVKQARKVLSQEKLHEFALAFNESITGARTGVSNQRPQADVNRHAIMTHLRA